MQRIRSSLIFISLSFYVLLLAILIQPYFIVYSSDQSKTLAQGKRSISATHKLLSGELESASLSQPQSIEDSALYIIEHNCLACHGSVKSGGLDLRERVTALNGGSKGPAIIPGKSNDSLLIKIIEGNGDLRMPPNKKLSPDEIKILRDWIDQGVKWPEKSSTSVNFKNGWWAFQPPSRPAVPVVKNKNWMRNPIDAFIMRKMEEKGILPVQPASKLALVRRVYFDLIGLPPTPEQVNAFLEDESPNAYEKLIDQLLSSPHYGERWGRHWLDVARYADTGGYENDIYFPNAWRYRDYVIESFNEDKPYDQFVKEQIAADEIWPNDLDLEGTYEIPKRKLIDLNRRIGTTLYTIGPVYQAAALNPDQFHSERLADMADTTSAVFMGLTMACARCHDHKFDPIPQKDYFRLQAIFANSEPKDIPMVDATKIMDYYGAYLRKVAADDLKAEIGRLKERVRRRLIEQKIASLDKEMVEAYKLPAEKRNAKQTELAKQYEGALSVYTSKNARFDDEYNEKEKGEREELLKKIGQAYLDVPDQYPTATVLGHMEKPRDVHIEIRGDWRNKGEKVSPGFPSVTSNIIEPSVLNRRKDLALWLTQNNHPLTARVMVNRIWQWHFGKGIVSTANNFGRQGDMPSHPELLDWLASEFVAGKWSIKQIHKLIMLSNTYQLSTQYNEKNNQIDPENHLLWRMNTRRLEAEAIRDSILFVTGTLNKKMGGPPVVPPLLAEELEGLSGKDKGKWPATLDPEEPNRRSVYLFSKRTFKIPLLEIFDSPDSSFSCESRKTTNVAPQALALLNNDFVLKQATIFSNRLVEKYGNDPESWIEHGWEMALGRKPTKEEKEKALEIFGYSKYTKSNMQPKKVRMYINSNDSLVSDYTNALPTFCLMIFNLNEFIYID
jgi:Skp family chaperone for outer membrane proteins